ncbi:MAG: Na+/H+ antiporter NhaC family protein [Sandaracinaceae bacterium]
MGARLVVGALIALLLAPNAALAAEDTTPLAEGLTWLSILPPLVAIGLAIALREVVISLMVGVWLGATFAAGFRPLEGLLRTADHYAVGALADEGHSAIAIFSLLLGGMIGVIARSGGAQGLADRVTRVATTRLRGGLATWVLGLLIFFDDYSNSLLVGTSMRPITDRLRISREKLAFLVDGTAAPVSSFALISSWVGVEVGFIADQYAALGLDGDAYLVFLSSIPYLFYPLLMLVFGLAVVVLGRDFGPMWHAEVRAVRTGHVSRPGSTPASEFDAPELRPPPGKRSRAILALLPIAVVVLTAIVGMGVTGSEGLAEERREARAALEVARAEHGAEPGAARAGELRAAEQRLARAEPSLAAVVGKADSLTALLWAAFLGGIVAVLLAVAYRVLRLREAMNAWVAGVRSIALAVIILVLAWSLGEVCQDLGTATYVAQVLGRWLAPGLLPGVVFLIAAAVSFATGTSWGTMGILFPVVIPLAHQLSGGEGPILIGAIASVLAGSVWGDHCSPISDTTVMSSMASSCDHVDHVRTQLPYALAVGAVSLLLGCLPTGLGWWSPAVALPLGALVLVGLVAGLGRPVTAEP